MTRNAFRLAAFIICVAQTWAASFDRQMFLVAVGEKIKSEPYLMEPRSLSDTTLRIETNAAKTTGWQKDLMPIPVMLPSSGSNASFGIALAYLASQELKLPFSSRSGDALVLLVGSDDANLSVSIDTRFSTFGNLLLQAVFDERQQCSLQYPVFRGTPAESQFANSICADLKQVVVQARTELKNHQLLISGKEAAQTAIRRAQDLLHQVSGYENAPVVEASIGSLTASIEGNDLNEIRSKEQALVNVSRELEQIVSTQHARADALADARQAANRELTKTQNLLKQANNYDKPNRIASAQRSLEQSLTGENADDIKLKTEILQTANQELDQFIRQQHTPISFTRATSSSEDGWLMFGGCLAILVVFGFFSTPTVIAFSRRHRSRWAILVLNLALGATLIGWIIALIWAMNKVDDPVKGGMKLGSPDPFL